MINRVIKESEIINIINNISNGEFIGIVFIKKDGSRRVARAQFGVSHPKDGKAPTGTGESFEEALLKGRLKFYDTTVPGYRQAALERIISITSRGITYEVNHNEDKVAFKIYA